MRIAFDGTTLRPVRTGVGYYTDHLLHHLAEGARDDELTVVSNRPVSTTGPLPPHVRVDTGSRRLPRMLWMQIAAPAVLRRLEADIAHFTNGMMPLRSPIPTVVTIHDMSLRLYPRYHPTRRVLFNRPLVDLAAHRADAIITVSESARREIVDVCGVAPERVHVVYEAAAPAFHPVRDATALASTRRRYALPDRFVLYVGTIEPRKNLPLLLQAFARQWRTGALSHHLVCAGPYGWLSRDLQALIERLQIGPAIRFLGYVPFDDLPVIYSLADMFVFPSLYEGFGLPVIEAMACGTPVITGEVGALAEIGGDATERVDCLEADPLGERIVALARNRERREQLSALGLERARAFSWRRAAQETLAVYRQVAKASPARAALPESPAFYTTATAAARAGAGHGPRATAADAGVDVLIGQAYYLRFDPKLWAAQQPYAPLGALYAAAAVRQHGYSVGFFDAMLASSEAEWVEALGRHRPRVAVIYEDSFNYLSKMCLLRMRQAAHAMIEAAHVRGVPVVVAGSDASDHPALYVDRGATLVVRGEGEVTLVEALDALTGRRSTPLTQVAGLYVRDVTGPVLTPARSLMSNLDALPHPAWDLVDVERYRAVWRRHHGYFSMNVVTTRGCPYHCNWCAKPIYGQRYHARSPESVAAEIAWLKRTYAPDHLWVADDIFGLKPGWIERFADSIVAGDAVVPFKCLLRADGVTEATARALRASGCRIAWIGAESGSQRILDAMEKGIRVDQIVLATRRLRRVGIDVGFFLQFGYPGETAADIERTLQMVRDCRPDDIGVSVSYPLPGTPFYERVKTQLGDKQNWVDSDDLAMLYRGAYAPEFYRALHALVHAEFRSRRSFDALGQVVRRRESPNRPLTRELMRAAYHTAHLPFLRWRTRQLARATAQPPPPVPPATLSREAASVPTEQPR